MTTVIILLIILIIIILLLVDFFVSGANLFADKWLRRILWVWLPFYALYALTKDLIAKLEGKK